ISMGVFGLALSGLGWALTRKTNPPAVPVQRPGLELGVVLGFLALYAVGFLGFGLTALRHAWPDAQQHQLAVLAAKLAVHVALPALLLAALGARLAPLFSAGLQRKGVVLTLVVLAAILLGLLS